MLATSLPPRAASCVRSGLWQPDGNPVIVPLLALSGGLDDWTPAARCVALANMPANRLMSIQVHPSAYHTFDVQGMRDHYCPASPMLHSLHWEFGLSRCCPTGSGEI